MPGSFELPYHDDHGRQNNRPSPSCSSSSPICPTRSLVLISPPRLTCNPSTQANQALSAANPSHLLASHPSAFPACHVLPHRTNDVPLLCGTSPPSRLSSLRCRCNHQTRPLSPPRPLIRAFLASASRRSPTHLFGDRPLLNPLGHHGGGAWRSGFFPQLPGRGNGRVTCRKPPRLR